MQTNDQMPPKVAATVAAAIDRLDRRGGRLIRGPQFPEIPRAFEVHFDPPEKFHLIVTFNPESLGGPPDYVEGVTYHGITYLGLEHWALSYGIWSWRPNSGVEIVSAEEVAR